MSGLAFDAAKKFLSLVGAPVEIVRELFGEGVQPKPGMLVIRLQCAQSDAEAGPGAVEGC